MTSTYRRIDLRHDDWFLRGVVVADSHRVRRVGVRSRDVTALLLWAASVHTFALKRPIHLTSISREGEVGEGRLVPPRRLLAFRTARWILETPATVAFPPPGSTLVVLPSDLDDRHTHHLRNPDRQPRGPI